MLSRPLSAERRRLLAAQVEKYHAEVGAASNYLNSRGITQHSIDRFQLGYVTDSDNTALVGRLAIPYLTPTGPVQLKYRCIHDHDCRERQHPKYLHDEGAALHLYNAQALLNTDRVIVCEGELDVIAAEQAGVAAVGYPGTQAWDKNSFWVWCFDSVTDVAVVADGDDAGRKAARKVASLLGDAVDAAVRVVYMPDGEDTNSYLTANDEIAFADKIGWL